MNRLRLEVLDFKGPTRWRWRLTTDTGAFLADHQVNLDEGSAEYEAFSDLDGYLRVHAAHDRRLQSENELLEWVGDWIGEQVWGPVGAAMVARRPAVVRLGIPAEPAGAVVLAYRPLELGYVNGTPLGLQRVSLIIEPPGAKKPADGDAEVQVEGSLRVLGLFSLPEGTGALNLRRERYQLTRQLQRIATARRPRRAIDLRVVQYGATRERLVEVVKERPGWDVLHVSGHGLPGGLVLEDPQGRPDVVSSDELVELLEWAAPRLKLVVLSSCDSAATTLSEARQLLGLDPGPDLTDAADAAADGSADEQPEARSLPAVARALTQRLGCAVVAMRYPVGDDFAIDLGRELYVGLLDKRQPLPGALQQALPAALKNLPSPGTPPLSVATPALFGPRAADLQLEPPAGKPGEFRDVTSLAYVDDQPKRFVGRVGVMLRAGEALAPESGWSGVLLHGMAGGGKTAIALELAYGHADQFPDGLVWHKAPNEAADITDALTAFVMDLEHQLERQTGKATAPKLVHLVDDQEALRRSLPELTEFMQQRRVLVVLDNLESLLTEQGKWRDDRWGMVVTALVTHDGLSRVVLTSRTRPKGLDARVRVEPVHALSLDEALLLAYELPNLGKLLNGADGTDPQTGRALVRRTLRVVQGHPKLLELADGQAQDPKVLAARLDEADQVWADGEARLGRFFKEGESAAEPSEFLRVLEGWTHSAAAGLPEAARLLFGVLCCLEEGDRSSVVLEHNWADIWQRLERPGDPPTLDTPIAALTISGLMNLQDAHTDQQEREVSYQLHPGVAAAGRTTATQAVADAVDQELVAFWITVFQAGLEQETGEVGGAIVHAGLAAAPYLLRRHDWETAGSLLEQALRRDRSVGTAAAVLPLLRRITQATTGTDQELINRVRLARALGRVQPGADEPELRTLLHTAHTRGQPHQARAIAGDLIYLLRATGRLEEALDLADQKAEWTRQAGPGPWTQLADQAQRLQLLLMLGRNEEVLAQVQTLRPQMASLPTTSQPNDTAEPWDVRELILHVGVVAAGELGHWVEALALNAEVATSEQRRDAHPLRQASTRFNDSGPLIALGHITDARDLLHALRDVYARHHALAGLAKATSALAGAEDKLGHRDAAITLAQDGLRLGHATGDPDAIAVSHHNLANYMHKAGRDPAQMLAHRLAAAVIRLHTRQTHQAQGTTQALARDLASIQGTPPLPRSFADLCHQVDQTPGVHLEDLIGRLPAYPGGPDAALAETLDQARALPTEEAGDQ